MMLAQMANALVGSVSGFASASIESRLQEAIQDYRNTMAKLNGSLQMNAIGRNEVATRDQASRTLFDVQQRALEDQSQAEFSAAVAGVTGNSVKTAVNDLKASAGQAEYAVKRNTQYQMNSLRDQRTSTAIAAVTGQDVTVIPKPSPASALLGLGTELLDIYDSNAPEGSRLFGPNGGHVGDTNLL